MKKKFNKNQKRRLFFVAIFNIVGIIFQPLVLLAADPITSSDLSAGVNATQSKIQMPSMSVVFDKKTIRAGEKITATANPSGFMTEQKDLYYTWYLKRANNDLGNDAKINEAKIEAARIIARGDFQKPSSYPSLNIDGKGFLALPAWNLDKNDYSNDSSTVDRINEAESQNCYLQNYKTGKIYEISTSESNCSCPSGSTPGCATTTANIQCSYENPLNLLIPTPDPLEPPILQTKTACRSASDFTPNATLTSSDNFSSIAKCADGTTPKCLINGYSSNSGFVSNNATDSEICISLGVDNAIGVSCDDLIYKSGSPLAEEEPICTREKTGTGCKHLFAQPNDSGNGSETGNNKYKISEEEFWGTNPVIPSTAGNGAVDEKNIVGVGINQFTWTYEDGDEIGVVIEGKSVNPTKHDDATGIITWAFSKNTCSKFEDISNNDSQYYINNSTGFLTISDFDVDNCLKENLIDPAKAGIGMLTVDLTYSPQNPVNIPISVSNEGDIVTIESSVSMVDDIKNPVDSSSFFYNWRLEKNINGTNNPEDSGWQDITADLSDKTKTSGIGNSKFSFKLNLNRADIDNLTVDVKYLRAILDVTESTSNLQPRNGRGNVIIPINFSDRSINVYAAGVDNGMLYLDQNTTVCNNTQKYPCKDFIPVIKNEILAVKIDKTGTNMDTFKWTYNKENLACEQTFSKACADGNVAFLPVTGSEGNTFTVEVEAKNGKSGASKLFAKTFVVVKPKIFITSGNIKNIWQKNLGYSKDIKGQNVAHLSGEVFQTVMDTEVTLQAITEPAFIRDRGLDNIQYAWEINGETNNSNNNKSLIGFKATETGGSSYNVDIIASYYQKPEIRTALQNIWQITPFESREEKMENSIQIEVLPNNEEDSNNVAAGMQKAFFANIISDLPQQTMFLLRIFLTTLVLLVTIGIVFSFISEGSDSGKKNL